MKNRVLAAIAVVALLFPGGVGVVAADPVTPYTGPTDPTNCLGQDRADFAQNGIPLFGIGPGSDVAQNLVKVFATAGGIGNEVQAHRAGDTLPADLISTCND